MLKINPSYMSKVQSIAKKLTQPFSVVRLHSFFSDEVYSSFRDVVTRLNFAKQLVPDKYSYRRASIPKKMLSFLHSDEFLSFLSLILGNEIVQLDEGYSYCFSWKNYTLLHDEMILKPGIDLIFDFTDEWADRYGGSLVYTGKDQAVIASLANSITIVKRTTHQRFVKYVNNHAGNKKRFFVLVTLDTL